MNTFRFWTLAVLLMLIFAAVVAGNTGGRSRGDAGGAHYGSVDRSAPLVIRFNRRLLEVETKCDGFGHRLYALIHEDGRSPNLIVIPDRSCQGPGTSFDDILRSHEQPSVQAPSTNPADYPPTLISP